MDSLKIYLIEVVAKKLGPSAIRGAILGIVGWLMTKNDLLEAVGIVSDQVDRTTTIHWDKLETWAIAGIPAVLAVGLKLFSHHTEAVIAQKPQSGNMRQSETLPTPGGNRVEDKGETK